MGAEAQVARVESWQEAQDALYKALGGQMKALWSTNTTKPLPAPTTATAPQEPPPPQNYCEAHGKPLQRHEKGGKVWYSHKAA